MWSTPWQSLLALLIVVPVTVVLAALSFYLIERPLMGWGKKRLPAI
jgi:peptidoglycan/LPS O-acetylase OafA/YrhL